MADKLYSEVACAEKQLLSKSGCASLEEVPQALLKYTLEEMKEKTKGISTPLFFLATDSTFAVGENAELIAVPYMKRETAIDIAILSMLTDNLKNDSRAYKYWCETRKHKPESIDRFCVGYLGNKVNIAQIQSKVKNDAYLAGFGLLKRDDEKQVFKVLYPKADHLVFPLFDEAGDLSQLTFKPISKEHNPFSTPKSTWKMKVQAYPNPPKTDSVIIVEGQHDAISITERYGLEAIATLGSVSNEQAAMIAEWSRR